MKKIIGLILILGLVYYGVKYHSHMNQPTVQVDERLVPFVNEWIEMMDEEQIRYVYEFNDINLIAIVEDSVVLRHMRLYNMKGPAVALSDPITQMIIIGESQAAKGEHTLRATVWHELGHYIYNLHHVDGYYLMNEYSYSEKEYEADWDMFKTNYLIRCKRNERPF
jgi:Zn-dependent peptidase ImmA (M78 family)